MKIEVEIPDEETAQEFATLEPPPGVKIVQYSTAMQGDGAIGPTSIIIQFAINVGSIIVADLILRGFSKYKKKHPQAKTRINYRKTKLETKQVVRFIEEVRTTEYEPEQKDSGNQADAA